MAEFLLGAAAFILAMVALGLVRVLRGPADADRMMAAQLLGTGGIAAVLLLGAATGEAATVDVALTLALLAAFASFAFVKAQPGERWRPIDARGRRRERRPRSCGPWSPSSPARSSFSPAPSACCASRIRSRACTR